MIVDNSESNSNADNLPKYIIMLQAFQLSDRGAELSILLNCLAHQSVIQKNNVATSPYQSFPTLATSHWCPELSNLSLLRSNNNKSVLLSPISPSHFIVMDYSAPFDTANCYRQ